MHRERVNPSVDHRIFRYSANLTKAINTGKFQMRGGIRL